MKNTKKHVRWLTRTAIVAALYATLAYVSSPLQFAGFQFRISEALCILPVFMPEAVLGLYLGAMLANYITGCLALDIIFGAAATLIGALGAYFFRGLPRRWLWLTTVTNVVSNTVIVPFICIHVYGAPESYWFIAFTVFVGEVVTGAILGTILLFTLDKRRSIFK
jgi:uncharacterized membrane protein